MKINIAKDKNAKLNCKYIFPKVNSLKIMYIYENTRYGFKNI